MHLLIGPLIRSGVAGGGFLRLRSFRHGFLRRCVSHVASVRRDSEAVSSACGPGVTGDIALLIDCDQVGVNDFKTLLESLSSFGNVVHRRAYLNRHHAQQWASTLSTCDIIPVIVDRRAGGSKSPVDIEIAMDAQELALRSPINHLGGVAIASHDMDYLSVLCRVRSRGLRALLVQRSARDGGSHTARQLAKTVGAEIVTYGNKDCFSTPRVAITLQNDKALLLPIPHNDVVHHDEPKKLNELRCVLSKLGYIPADGHSDLTCGLAKLFFVNSLGPFTVYPTTVGLRQASTLLAADVSHWKPDPGNLIFVMPLGTPTKRRIEETGSEKAAAIMAGGGPFIVESSDKLLDDILFRLGYLTHASDREQAMSLFWVQNSKQLKSRGVDVSIDDPSLRKDQLMQELRRPYRQQFHIAPSDKVLRTYFKAQGWIADKNAPQEVVLAVVNEFLKQNGERVSPSDCYLGLVVKALRVLNKDDPYQRKTRRQFEALDQA